MLIGERSALMHSEDKYAEIDPHIMLDKMHGLI
jgi:hypothetical protein